MDGDAAEATTRTIEPVRFGSFLSCEAHLLHHSGVYTKYQNNVKCDYLIMRTIIILTCIYIYIYVISCAVYRMKGKLSSECERELELEHELECEREREREHEH